MFLLPYRLKWPDVTCIGYNIQRQHMEYKKIKDTIVSFVEGAVGYPVHLLSFAICNSSFVCLQESTQHKYFE